MIPILEYIAQVHERAQKTDFIKRTPHMDLVEDFMFDIQSNNPIFHSDEDVIDYLNYIVRDGPIRQAFDDFKRNYRAWRRRHK